MIFLNSVGNGVTKVKTAHKIFAIHIFCKYTETVAKNIVLPKYYNRHTNPVKDIPVANINILSKNEKKLRTTFII